MDQDPEPIVVIPGLERRKRVIKSKKTIRDDDWNCFHCGNVNFQFRIECNQCKLQKNDAQSDRFRMLEENETRGGPGEVFTDNSDE